MPDQVAITTDEAFIAAFESCTLPPGAFHHADHVRLAWLYLNQYALMEAIERFTSGLKRFTAANGVPQKYHETITWAFLLLTNERMHSMERPHTWEQFAELNTDLLDWNRNILGIYYQQDTLKSERARCVFVLPDKGLSARVN